MHSAAEIIERLGGVTEVGRILGKAPQHIWSMKSRGSIPVAYWPALIDAAKTRGISLTADVLTNVHACEVRPQNEAAQVPNEAAE
jgi:hypothetical protein